MAEGKSTRLNEHQRSRNRTPKSKKKLSLPSCSRSGLQRLRMLACFFYLCAHFRSWVNVLRAFFSYFSPCQQGRTQHSSKVANEPPSKNQPAFFFFLFLLSPTEACFLTNESKANEFDRRSFATLELEVTGELQRRRTGWAGSGSSISRSPKGVNVMHKA